MLVPKDFPYIHFIEKYILKDRTIDEINPLVTISVAMRVGWAPNINLITAKDYAKGFQKGKRNANVAEEGRSNSSQRQKRRKPQCYHTSVNWI